MREKIIEATIREFSKNGLKFTMNDLAKQLGISKKTIYTVFESKQAVLVAVADYYTADLDSMRKELEEDTSLDVIQKFEKLLCALPEKYYNIGLSRIYELSEKYPKPYRHLMRAVNRGWDQAQKYLKEGMEAGLIREVSIPVVMAMVKGTVYSFMETDVLYQNELTYEQAKKQMVEILMKGIRAGGRS